jgi:hypothetical protein
MIQTARKAADKASPVTPRDCQNFVVYPRCDKFLAANNDPRRAKPLIKNRLGLVCKLHLAGM